MIKGRGEAIIGGEMQTTDKVRRAVIQLKTVRQVEGHLARANMKLTMLTEGFTKRELDHYAKLTGAIPSDNRYGNSGRKKGGHNASSQA